MTELNYQLDNISCENCVKTIGDHLERLDAIANYDILFERSQVKVALDEDEVTRDELAEQFVELGYPVLKVKEL